MRNKSNIDISSFRTAVRTAARVARKKAFRKGFPVAISKNGKVVFVYKNSNEVELDTSSLGISKSK